METYTSSSTGVYMYLYVAWHLLQQSPNFGSESDNTIFVMVLLYRFKGTLAHALVVLHNALPTGHENSHNGWTHGEKDVGCGSSIFEVLIRRYSTIFEAFLKPRIAT